MTVMVSPVAGFTVGNVFPEAASTHLPQIGMKCRGGRLHRCRSVSLIAFGNDGDGFTSGGVYRRERLPRGSVHPLASDRNEMPWRPPPPLPKRLAHRLRQ